MRTLLCFGALLVSAASAGSLVRSTGSSRTHRADDGLGNYEFGYDEVHSTGGTFRRESGNAVGAKVGSYGLRDIDGRYRVVNYVADAAGFRAQVSTNEPGTAPSLTGAASYNAAPVVASRLLSDIASPIYGTRVAPAVAPVPAFNAAPVYSAPAVGLPAPVAFGARVPVASRIAYAAPAVAPISAAYTAPVAAYAPRIPTFAAPVARVAPVVPSYATRLGAPINTFAAPAIAYPAPVRAYAAPLAAAYASPVAAYAAPRAPVAESTAVPQSEMAAMNSAPTAALPSRTLRAGNNARLFSEAAAVAPSYSMNNALPSYSANSAARLSSPDRETRPTPMATNARSAPVSAGLSTAESDSTETVAPRTEQAATFPYFTSTNFLSAPNFTAPQFSFPAAFNPAPPARFESARNAPVSDAPVTPVPSFASAAPATTVPTASAPVANSTAPDASSRPAFNAPFLFSYSFPESDIGRGQQQPQTTPAPIASVSTTAAPIAQATPSAPLRSSAPFLAAVNAAFPAGTYAGPLAAPRVNETRSRSAGPSTPAPRTDSPASFFAASREDEVPFDHQITFSSQRLRAPIYAPVVAAPVVPQYAVYAPVAHYSSSVHTRVDFASSAPARRHDQRGQAPAAQPESSPMTPEAPQSPPPQPPTPQPGVPAPTTPAAETPRAPAVEATTPMPNADDDEDVADPRNAPPMLSAREETFTTTTTTTTTQTAPTTASETMGTTVAPTTEVPVAAEANGQRSPASDAALLNADRPVAARVVARRRPSFSVYNSRVIRAPSAYRVFVPQYAHVRSAPVTLYAAAPVVVQKVAHVPHAVRYY